MDQLSERNDASNDMACKIAAFLEEQGGEDVRALDISQQSGFADSFVLVSAPGFGRLRGLYRRAHEITSDLGLDPRQSHKREDESGWLLLDCGSIIVHIMLKELRNFYELEKLWFDAPTIYPEDAVEGPTAD